MSRWIRSPLLHFIAIGAALYAVQIAWSADAPDPPIVVDAEQLALLEAVWVRQAGRPPDAVEREALVARHVEDELLIREAMALGWNRTDPVIHQRLVRNQRFLEADAGREASDAELLAAAYEMGMDETDLVVRRRLLSRARLAIAAAARAVEPSDDELQAYLERHSERFRRPAELRLTQVFLSRDRRAGSLRTDAETLVARLRREAVAPRDAAELGDSFLVPAELPLSSRDRLASRLGGAFAAAVEPLPLGVWSGPIPSSYGLHAVWVHERRPSEVPSLDEVRRAVRAALLSERERDAIRDRVALLRARAEVRVEAPASSGDGRPGEQR